jgi:hypothetical protein
VVVVAAPGCAFAPGNTTTCQKNTSFVCDLFILFVLPLFSHCNPTAENKKNYLELGAMVLVEIIIVEDGQTVHLRPSGSSGYF